MLRRRGRPGDCSAHQGCLTEDHAFLLANDELDEQEFDTNTRTIVVEVRDLQNPTVHFEHFHDTYSIDHNNYVHEGLAYEPNYTSGLRVLDTAVVRAPALAGARSRPGWRLSPGSTTTRRRDLRRA